MFWLDTGLHPQKLSQGCNPVQILNLAEISAIIDILASLQSLLWRLSVLVLRLQNHLF